MAPKLYKLKALLQLKEFLVMYIDVMKSPKIFSPIKWVIVVNVRYQSKLLLRYLEKQYLYSTSEMNDSMV